MEFFAEWCAPCRVLESEVLPDPRVKKALDRFLLVRVDTDRFQDVSWIYNIATLPTVLILDERGAELDRIAGMIDAETLAERLTKATQARRPSPPEPGPKP